MSHRTAAGLKVVTTENSTEVGAADGACSDAANTSPTKGVLSLKEVDAPSGLSVARPRVAPNIETG